MNKLLLIDGNSLVYRAYYATAYLKSGILTNDDGLPVNAIHIFAKIIQKSIRLYKPTHILVAFDAGKKTFRHKKLESYKAGRKSTPKELIEQMPFVKEMLDKMGIARFELSNIEADDIIGTLAKKFSSKINTFIMSSDKDLYQLVDKDISIIIPQNGAKDDVILTNDSFVEKLGYRPDQVTDIKGLMGDASDNLPGVAGIGPKGALKLIDQYKSIEGIYQNIEKISEKLRQKLINSKEMAFLTKEISSIDINVPMKQSLKDLYFSEKVSKSLVDFFEKIHLKSHAKYYGNILNAKIVKSKEKSNDFENIIL